MKKRNETDSTRRTTSLRDVLARYDAADLAAGVGALQLLPENANNHYRLESSAVLVASLPFRDGRPRMARAGWQQLLNTDLRSAARAMEDPHEDVFCRAVAFHGGAYRTIASSASDSIFLLELSLSALAGMDGSTFQREAIRDVRAALALSEGIACSAGLSRGALPEGTPGGVITVPPSSRFGRLKAAVRFSKERLDAIVGTGGRERLAALLLEVGADGYDQEDITDDTIFRYPILDTGCELIVTLPGALPVAIRHELACRAMQAGLRESYSRAFQEAVLAKANHAMLRQLAEPAPVRGLPDCNPRLVESFFSVDVDKLAHVLVMSDDLRDYPADTPFGRWSTAPTADEVKDRVDVVRTSMLNGGSGPSGLLHVLVIQSFGRHGSLGLGAEIQHPDCPVLVVRPSELGIMTRTAPGDPLSLWKFAKDQQRLRDKVKTMPMTTLDEFSLYHSNDSSFYLSDEALPDVLVIPPGESAGLRWEDSSKHDVHAVVLPDGRRVAEVSRRYAGSSIPIYVVDPLQFRAPMYLVEGLELPVWVTVRNREDRLSRFLGLLCESVAYWIWQLSADIEELVGALASESQILLVEVDLEDDGQNSRSSTTAAEHEGLTASTSEPSTITLCLGAGAEDWLDKPDNRGERAIVRALVDSVNALGAELADRLLDCDEILTNRAPVGNKRMVVALRADRDWELLPGELPRHRLLHPNDTSRCLDGLGVAIGERLAVGVGPVADDLKNEALKHAVAIHFESLTERVAALNPTGLLEFLVAHEEALIREDALSGLNLATRSECFGEDQEYLADIEERLNRMATSHLASRFLIEYVVAQPPGGDRRISLATYDYLLALCADLITKGMLGDAVHYGLAEPALTLLPSGRLGIDREDAYLTGLVDYRPIGVTNRLRSARTDFARNWRDPDSGEPDPSAFGGLEEAAEAEFGFGLSKLANFFASIGRLSIDELTDEPRVASATSVRDRLCVDLDLSEKRSEALLDLFTLRPRQEFIPAGKGPRVYPWRFNRDLSYARRPFLRRSGPDGEFLIWGIRHLGRTSGYFLDLCTSGRLQATSDEMKTYASRMRSESADLFNDMVAELFDQPGLLVRSQVEKVGHVRIERALGESLGDVDVLVASPMRRRLLAIEAKDLSHARTPAELSNQIAKLFTGEDSTLRKHLERVEWLKNHIDDVKRWLGVSDNRSWGVRPLIVTSRDLLSPFIQASRIQVISYRMLAEEGFPWLAKLRSG